MFVPSVSEAMWTHRLVGLSSWKPGTAPTVVVAPHPDDETLAVDVLIKALRTNGVDVIVVAVTDGEHAYADNQGLARLRREEQTRALARLGVREDKILRLGLPDSSVATREKELVERLRPQVNSEAQIVAPWVGDFHPDHEACARAADIVARETGASLVTYFFWTWHRGNLSTLDGLELRSFTLTD